MQVLVRDNNVDQALKALKKKMQREGLFREMKLRNYYEKPSERRAREKAEAVRRARKLARKRAQREGLIAAPKPRPTRRAPLIRPTFGALLTETSLARRGQIRQATICDCVGRGLKWRRQSRPRPISGA